jgi:hypothetical protein
LIQVGGELLAIDDRIPPPQAAVLTDIVLHHLAHSIDPARP